MFKVIKSEEVIDEILKINQKQRLIADKIILEIAGSLSLLQAMLYQRHVRVGWLQKLIIQTILSDEGQ